MENYERKYKEALEWMQSLYSGLHGATKEDAEHYFPELKESEDERIRKWCISHFNACINVIKDNDEYKEYLSNKVIAWLEKQGEQKSTLPKWRYKKDHTPLLKDSLILNKYGCMGKSPSGAIVSDVWVLDYDELAKLPKEELEEQGGQKHTDKVEPKFKVGDWILNDVCFPMQIASIKDSMYVFTKGDAISVSFVDENYHLWSIKDAEDGDVLTANVQRGELGYDEYPFRYIPITFIYRKTNKDDYIHSYCDMLCVYGVLNPSYRIFSEYFIKDIYPATKEQCDLLFQKMKEEGYEWNSENKEVKRIESKKVNTNKVINWVNPDSVIKWLKNTIKKKAENYGVYKEIRLILPYNCIEDLINDFKKNFGL